MYVNGKMRPVETIPRVGGRRIKENDGGVNSTVNVTVYPQYNNNNNNNNKTFLKKR
jgi:hypothetical protein